MPMLPGTFGPQGVAPNTGAAPTIGVTINPATGRPWTAEEWAAVPKPGYTGLIGATPIGFGANLASGGPGRAIANSPGGQFVSAVGGNVDLGGLADAAGLTRPDLGNLRGDTDALRQMRRDFASEYGGLAPRGVPQVGAERAAGVDLGPAATMEAAQLARAREVSAPALGSVERAQAALAMAAPVQRVGPTQAATIDRGGSDDARSIQSEAIRATRDVLSGAAPSVAERQLQETLNQNVQQQNAVAAGARGLSAASARRQAAQNIARLNLDTGAKGALLRAQEQATARGQLGGLATDTRGQDIGLATSQAGFQQQATQSDADRAVQENLTQARLGTDVSQSNAANATGIAQFNAGQANQRGNLQGQMQLQAAEGNAGRDVQQNVAQAGFQQQAGLANMGAVNDRASEQGRLTQGNQQFNATQGNQVATNNADRVLTGQGQDDRRASELRGSMISAGRSSAESELGGLRVDEEAKARRTGLVSNVAKSTAAAFGLAAGGVVTRPTLALVGEAGPEVVMPVSRVTPDERRRFAVSQRPFSRDSAPPLSAVVQRRREAAREMSY